MQLIPKEVITHIEGIYTIPKEQNISLATLEQDGFVKAQTAKLLIHRGELKGVKFGKKFFIPRMELIRYLANQLNLIDLDIQSNTKQTI